MIENSIKETIKWYDIIFQNWSQIVVLVGVIGYIIRLCIEYKIKKKEISYSKIQDLKIEELKDFFKSYFSLKVALESFLNQTEFGEHSDTIFNNIRKEIRDSHIDFENKSMTIKLFFKENEVNYINEILDVFKVIKINIEKWHIYKGNPNPPLDWDKLKETREFFLKQELPDLIKKIEISFRKSYYV